MQLRKLAPETFLEQAANFTLMLGSSCKRTFDSNFVHGSHGSLARTLVSIAYRRFTAVLLENLWHPG